MNTDAPAQGPSAAFASDASAASAQSGPNAATQDSASAPLGLADSVRAIFDDLRRSLAERVKLLGLELRLAGMTLLQLVIYAVMVAVLVVTAWLGLVGAVVMEFIHLGLHWAPAIAIGVVINLAVAAWLLRSMVRMIERVGMPASLRRAHKTTATNPSATATSQESHAR